VARLGASSTPAFASKREALIKAGEEQFRLHGLRRTSMEAIAAAANVAKATAYAYFRNKEEVFHAVCASVVGRITESIQAASERAGTPMERVHAIVETKLLSLYELVHRSPHAADLMESGDRIAAEILARGDALYHQLLRTSLIAARVAPRQAGELATIIEHTGWGLSENAQSAPQLKRRVRRLLAALLAAER
jgi:AcrR family transcriptional regulator